MDLLAPYRPHTVVLPETMRRSDVGAAAWWWLHDVGVVRPLWGDVAIASDLEETAARRSRAIADLVPSRGVVGRQSAVWLHTGQFAPRRVDVLVATRSRRAEPHPLRSTAESTWGADDVVQVGSIRATTVQRTGVDICRHLPPGHALRLLEPLLEAGFDPVHARVQLEGLAGHRGILGARNILRRLTDSAGEDLEPDPGAQPPL
ncbi:hypothetical protein [Cellulomonas sp. URHD0024]|uniref:hypothetical protein n=1 Tax=Cellulomonas sp. URHD0024 TaxID=1302620 RepID=UPI00040DBD9B|nr:hypothetical protein [Cellulomonas sp. URHD0024]